MGLLNTEESKNLMEVLRKRPPKVKRINDIVQLLHVITSDQQTKNLLRTCADKVFMNITNIHSLRDILERLRSVSRTNGMRFKLDSIEQESSLPETKCHLHSENMFNVEIILVGSRSMELRSDVKDVKIQHFGEVAKSCPELVKIISDGKFLELSRHLKGLTEMYLSTVNRQMRTKVYMALQSFEADLIKMSKVYGDTNKNTAIIDTIMKGTVGYLVPRVGGEPSYLTYFVSPFDQMNEDGSARDLLTIKLKDEIGLKLDVSICESPTAQNLPITSLISNQHAMDDAGAILRNARFLDMGPHNSMRLQACYVLRLYPAVIILKQTADEIKFVTDIPVITSTKSLKPYMKLLGEEKKLYKVYLENSLHTFHLGVTHLMGEKIEKIYLSHPNQLTKILSLLRRQAHFNTIISSCLHNSKVPQNYSTYYYDVSYDERINRFNITFEHPDASRNSTAFMEVNLEWDGSHTCKLFTSHGDPALCSNTFATKILRKCSSLPITMIKILERSLISPQTGSAAPKLSAPALFSPSKSQHQANARVTELIAAVSQSSLTLPLGIKDEPTTDMIQLKSLADGDGKKIVQNPMLARLLIPTSEAALSAMQDKTVQPQNHPMLMNLLKESEGGLGVAQQSEATSTGNYTQFSMSQQQHQQKQFAYSQSNIFKTSPAPPYNMVSPSHMSQMPEPIFTPQMQPPPKYPGLQQQQGFQGNQHQMQLTTPPYSLQSPVHTMDEMGGPTTPIMQPGLISPGLHSPIHSAPTPGRRNSRQKSRSIEGQPLSVGSLDSQFDPTMQYDNVSSEQDSLDIFSPLAKLHTGSMSPSSNTHPMLHHSHSLQMPITSSADNSLMRSSSYSGNSSTMMSSPRSRTPKTPNLVSPTDFGQVRSEADIFFSNRVNPTFKTPSTPSTPATIGSRRDSYTGENKKDLFDDNKNLRVNMVDIMQKKPIKTEMNDPKFKALRKTHPGLIQALTKDSPPSSTQPAYTSPSLESLLTAPVTSSPTTSAPVLLRQNALDKNLSGMQRKISNKSEDGKVAVRRRGRPPGKEAGAKKRKVEKDAPGAIVLNVQLSPTGTPISSSTKMRPTPGPNASTEKHPPDIMRYLQNQEELKNKKKKEKDKEKVVGKKANLVPSISLVTKNSTKSGGQVNLQEKPATSITQKAAANFQRSSSINTSSQKARQLDDIITNLKADKNASAKLTGSPSTIKPIVEKSSSSGKETPAVKVKGTTANQKPATGGTSINLTLKSQDPKMKQTLSRITEEAAATAKGTKVAALAARPNPKLPSRQPSTNNSKDRTTPTLPSRVSPALGQTMFPPRKNLSPDLSRQNPNNKSVLPQSNQKSTPTSRPNSASSVDSGSSGSMRSSPVPSSSPTLTYNRKPDQLQPPTLSTIKRKSPVSGEERSSKIGKTISLKSKASSSTPVSPEDRLVIDDPTQTISPVALIGMGSQDSTREVDEQTPDPVFLSPISINKVKQTTTIITQEPSSPERAVWASPLSPNVSNSKVSTTRLISTVSIATPPSGNTSSPCNSYDDLMDQAVSDL